ncbi:MAG: glycosyltransferase [Planctomycetota bacterium]|jgi:glycosyltransferase involved in cell wall biosynthesis
MDLFVVTNNPDSASFRQRVEVHLAMLRNNDINCEVAKLPPGFRERRKLFMRTTRFDGILLHRKILNFSDAFWLNRYSRKIIYDFDDAVMFSTRKPGSFCQSRQRRFRRSVELANLIIAGNSYLARNAKKFNQRVKVLPTGLDTSAHNIRTKSENDGKIRLVWIGSKSTLRYLAQIKPALEKIGAIFDNIILRIICDEFFSLQNMTVEKQKWHKSTEAIDLKTSDIGLAPLPDDHFTRGKCGFKILQYAAAELPVVASPVGVNAEYVQDGVTGFHAINTTQWIDRVGKLIKDQELRKQTGQAGKVRVQEFDVNVLGKRLVNLIVEFLNS